MKWDKYTIKTTTSAEDVISAVLSELGIEGVEIENHVPLTEAEAGGMFIDFPLQLPPDDGTSRVSFYLDAGEDHTEILSQVRDELKELRSYLDIGSGEIIQSQTEDLDWMNNWKQYFTSFTIGNILIKPTWEELKQEDRDRILIEIDPGISFGTGKHETTQLCIRQLQKYIRRTDYVAAAHDGEAAGSSPDGMQCSEDGGCRVLDVGSGSGILAIAALKLGASWVTGIDIDENCISSAYENLEVNRLDRTQAEFYVGNLIMDQTVIKREGNCAYDIVTANILADVIIEMAPHLMFCLKKDGILITSGIIDFKEAETAEALKAAGFSIIETNRQGEWVNITARK